MEEKIFLDKGKVVVSNSRFIVDGQTYAMSNVTSVKSGVIEGSHSQTFILILIALACFAAGTIGFFMAVIFFGLAYYNAKQVKNTYTVILNTSAGENKALSSHDQAYVSTIIAALNDAIVSRG
ncbi:DUF6232 family protein [Shewanella basaltis]|uniref:DUF6232 family protein n=1 Tax=Shewanella basaltis TaxID=472183 RepID=UPI00200E87B2|nr:DUF6232 family protein [Shewanella basaltis]MCL1114691.1 DUF6232 family protein [Shewanella basaltis]